MKALATAAAIVLSLTAAASHAADGTITINGALTANTCSINNGSSADITVSLPTVSASSLQSAVQTAGSTRFSIQLSNCTASVAQTYFEAGPNISDSGNLRNNGSASNVEVQLLNNQGQVINLQNNSNSQQMNIVAGGASLDYYAQYYATGQSSAGSVSSSVKYTITYN